MASTAPTGKTRDGHALPMTSTAVGKLARQARRTGYGLDRSCGNSHRGGPGHGAVVSVRCPLAGPEWGPVHRITATLSQYETDGLSVPKMLDRAVAAHLAEDNETSGPGMTWIHECPGMRPVS